VLHTLQGDNWKLAIASNKFDDGTKRLVSKLLPDIHFTAVYGNREGFPLKPDATLLELIMKECGAVHESTTMVGDSGIDIKAAKNAKIRSIGCSWGFRSRSELEEYGADFIVDNPLELLQIL
jgi:phosphoglycolate phosphatase